MITKQQAIDTRYRQELHYGDCKKVIGPRGGITITQTRVRVSGMCKTWVTRPDEFRLPVKYGLYGNAEITHRNAGDFHLECDCPLNRE